MKQPGPAFTPPAVRLRALVTYAVLGDQRFLSHRNEMRALARSMIRAGWPLRFTGGFNPQPHLTLPLPRSTGMASRCQVAIVDLASAVEGPVLQDSLAGRMPPGFVLDAVRAPDVPRALHPERVEYAFECAGLAVSQEELMQRVAGLLDAASALVTRRGKPGAKPRAVDVRPFVAELWVEWPVLRMVLSYINQQTARPAEVAEILGLADGAGMHRICRLAVQFSHTRTPGGAQSPPAAPEGDSLGSQEDDIDEQTLEFHTHED